MKLKTNQRTNKKSGNANDVETTDVGEEDSEEYIMFNLTAQDKEPYRVEINLNGVQTRMEIDTGAAVMIISEETFKNIYQGRLAEKQLEIKPAKVKLRTYTGGLGKVLGTVNIAVEYEGQGEKMSALLVVEESGPNLLGRDWLSIVKLNWKKLFKC